MSAGTIEARLVNRLSVYIDDHLSSGVPDRPQPSDLLRDGDATLIGCPGLGYGVGLLGCR